MTKQSISFYKEIEATIKNIISKRIPMHHIPNNQLRISTLQSRREALKQLRDLGILGIGGLLGLQHLAKQDNLALQFSQDSISNLANVDTITDSILETTFDTETFGDLSTVSDNPITSSFNISNTLNDLKEFDYLIQPRNGYSVSDFINKNLSNHVIIT